MRAIQVHTPGGPDALTLVTLPDPQPAAGQVRVRAQAIGVGRPDVLIRNGTYKWMPPLPANVSLALGTLMGTQDRAQELADNYQDAMADIAARVEAAGTSNKKVYVELAQKGPSEVGNSYGDTMWGALVDKLGGDNIAKGQIGNWGPLSPEYVLAQKPDLIFLAGSEWLNKPQSVSVGFGASNELARERMKAYLGRPGWSELPAVKNGDVHAIYHGGARTLSDYVFAQYIAKQLHPDAFKDVNPEQNLKDYYKAWLPIEADGTFVLPYQAVGQ